MTTRTLKRGKRWMFVCTAVAIVSAPLLATADSVVVNATFQKLQPNTTLLTNLTSNYDGTDAGKMTTTEYVYAGIYDFNLNTVTGTSTSTPLTAVQVEDALSGTTSPQGTSNNTNTVWTPSTSYVFQAVCIDFTHNISFGQSADWQVAKLKDVTSADNGVGINTNQANAIAYLFNYDRPQGIDPERAAIYQLAVWDLIYNGGGVYSSATGTNGTPPKPTVSYSGGSISPDDILIAENDAAGAFAAVTKTSASYLDNVYALVNENRSTQDFTFGILLRDKITNASPVPLPSAASAGFSMLGGLGLFAALRKRIGRRARIA